MRMKLRRMEIESSSPEHEQLNGSKGKGEGRQGRKRLRTRNTRTGAEVRRSCRRRKSVFADLTNMSSRSPSPEESSLSSSSCSDSSSDNEDTKTKKGKKRPRRSEKSKSRSKSKKSTAMLLSKFDYLLRPHASRGKRSKIHNEIQPIKPDPSLTFESVGGLQPQIEKLKEMVILPLLYKEYFVSRGVTPARGVLFHGPPGTGKTLLARALAGEATRIGGLEVSVFIRKGGDILNKWLGESERHLKLLFEQAIARQPSIIFFDEIDALAPMRSNKTDHVYNSVVSTFLAEMDGLNDRGNVIVIGATNRIESLDPALRRPGRFDLELQFCLPSYQGRHDIFTLNVSKWKPPISPESIDELALMTVGYSGADIKMLCAEASLFAIKRRYPQIYRSNQKFLLDYESIEVLRVDWEAAGQVVGRSTERSVSSSYFTAQALPLAIKPLLSYAVNQLHIELKEIFPYEEKPAVQPPGKAVMVGMGPNDDVLEHVISAALWDTMDGVSIQILTMQTLAVRTISMDDGSAIALFFTEVKKRGSAVVVYIPYLDHFLESLSPAGRLVFEQEMSKIFFHPILVIAFCKDEDPQLPPACKLFFKEVRIPSSIPLSGRCEFFKQALLHAVDIKVGPKIYPEEELPLAPIEPPTINPEEIAETERAESRVLRELRIFLREIIFKIIRNKKFGIFTKPVDPKDVPDYYDVVSEPMDLETMMHKVTNNEYQSAAEFLADIHLITNNCLNYNPSITDEDRDIRFRAFELKDVANSMVQHTMDSDFEEMCQEISKRRKERKEQDKVKKKTSGRKKTDTVSRPKSMPKVKAEHKKAVSEPDTDGYIENTGNLSDVKQYRRQAKEFCKDFIRVTLHATVTDLLELRFKILNLIEQHGQNADKSGLMEKLEGLVAAPMIRTTQ